MAAGTTITTGGSGGAGMKLLRVTARLALVMLGISGCAVEEHRDGAVTVRPLH